MEIATTSVEEAKEFWSHVNVDNIFNQLDAYLQKLREIIKAGRATDREYIWSMVVVMESFSTEYKTNAVEDLMYRSDEPFSPLSDKETFSYENVLLREASGNEEESCVGLTQNESDDDQTAASPSRDSIVSGCAPLTALRPPYHSHSCGPACLSTRTLSTDHILSINPLSVPLMCDLQRQITLWYPPASEQVSSAVLYKAPCGRNLRNADDVLRFLRETESDGVLQLDSFSFNASVQVECCDGPRGGAAEAGLLDSDVSRGVEATAVQLCNSLDQERPEDFCYRKDRWPHGCFLSFPRMFSRCCDCTDGCTDTSACACVRLSLPASRSKRVTPPSYTHKRLLAPVTTGIYECGPWCGCERDRCQNRVVQTGLRVRLQVFRTSDRGWGVRCRDDLDIGTFVCTYAGVLLQAQPRCVGSCVSEPDEPVPAKRKRDEQLMDDDVELVEEWSVSSGEKSLHASSPSSNTLMLDEVSTQGRGTRSKSANTQTDWSLQENTVTQQSTSGTSTDPFQCPLGQDGQKESFYYIDATKEGNVGRFLNHSCSPNLFVQNVFTDSHDRNFPTVAFFTSRMVKAGTELTWNYSYTPGSAPDEETSCRCGCEGCQINII